MSRIRAIWLAPRALTAVIAVACVAEWVDLLRHFDDVRHLLGGDLAFYVDAASRWVRTGQYYFPYQLAGPYTVHNGIEVLYPPTSLLLFLPFTVLPAVLWWAIPVSLTGWAIWKLRPAAVAWPIMAVCVLDPSTLTTYWLGNSTMWCVAAVAVAAVASWPAVLVVLKPTLGPFALLGIWRRSWWLALGGLVLISLPFGSMWVQYLHVGLNARDGLGWMYSVYQVPTMLIPVTAWVASERGLRRRMAGQGTTTGLGATESDTRRSAGLPLVAVISRYAGRLKSAVRWQRP